MERGVIGSKKKSFSILKDLNIIYSNSKLLVIDFYREEFYLRIEITYIKIIYIIAGIVSFVMPWMLIIATATVLGVSVSISAYYNFMGMVTEAYLGAIRIDTSGQEVNELYGCGLAYLIGYILCLINVKIDGYEKYKHLGRWGIIFIFLGIAGYFFFFMLNVQNAMMELESDPSTAYADYNIIFYPLAGMYAAIVCFILAYIEVYNKNLKYIMIYNSEAGLAAHAPGATRSRAIRYCEYCGFKITNPEAVFCFKCGKRITANTKPHDYLPTRTTNMKIEQKYDRAKVCPHCRYIIAEFDAVLCPNCGREIAEKDNELNFA